MAYKIISIGKEFGTGALKRLEGQLSAEQAQGWELVFIFPAVRTTCLFMKEETYLAVLRKG
ncbi:MAG: DUF4177 domain-containing protein [Candidatus Methylomirabilales bacterium]